MTEHDRPTPQPRQENTVGTFLSRTALGGWPYAPDAGCRVLHEHDLPTDNNVEEEIREMPPSSELDGIYTPRA